MSGGSRTGVLAAMYKLKTDHRAAQRRSYSRLKKDPAWVAKKAAQNAASYQRRKKRNGDAPRLESARERRYRHGWSADLNDEFFRVFHGCTVNQKTLEAPTFVVVYPDGSRRKEWLRPLKGYARRVESAMKLSAALRGF
jgi:hypothetical protein